jgi:hypothetical protein
MGRALGKPEGKRDLYEGERIMFRWILEKQDAVVRTGLICLRIWTSSGRL